MEKQWIFDYEDYKTFSLARISAYPKEGWGQLQRLAKTLSVHPTLVSQVFRGLKNFTPEQACHAADFFGLSESESDYYLALVEHERAGNSKLKKYWSRRLSNLREENRQVGNRIPPAKKLSPQLSVEFYSTWENSGVRMATSITGLSTPEAIAERLGLSPKRVREATQFLLRAGLCVERNGRVSMGPARTYVPSDSPLVGRHHLNWRIKALEAIAQSRKHEMIFTSPLTIARADRESVRKILSNTVEEISKLVTDSDAEEICCLNIDWFDVRSTQ